ncbi:hypothetical protein LTR37_004082 [Vermiconidia calcicola]|uniref:Uncharacterized protein n=1 Tax=Vermiconidia calcicola TaxID=1690605 RepID=A0ACC3NN48_9PEZI|nr:hypothetical protein LTR37_004082 [Vermiconidia calcicola]
MTVHHVYVCGHSEEEWVDGLDSPEYVFVEGVCSDSECVRNDPGWFREQCSLPGGAAMSTLADMTYELQTIRTLVMANFKQLDDLKPSYPGTWVDDADLDIDNREALLEQQYHFSLIQDMLRSMHRFSKSRSHRPFFDFCRREADLYLAEAKLHTKELCSAVRELRDSSPWDDWPDSDVHYEPDFGKEQLLLLRQAGEAGLNILCQPFDLRLLQQTEELVQCLKANPPALARPASVPYIGDLDSLEAYLQQEEDVFRAEMGEEFFIV